MFLNPETPKPQIIIKIENKVKKNWRKNQINHTKINLKTKLNKNKLLNFFQIMFNKFQRIITFISKNRDNLLLHFTNVQIEAKACLGLLKTKEQTLTNLK